MEGEIEGLQLRAESAEDCWQTPRTEQEERTDAPLWISEGAWPCQHFDFRLQPPEQWDNTFLLFQAA